VGHRTPGDIISECLGDFVGIRMPEDVNFAPADRRQKFVPAEQQSLGFLNVIGRRCGDLTAPGDVKI
jgi:hypothetical protein